MTYAANRNNIKKIKTIEWIFPGGGGGCIKYMFKYILVMF